MKIQIYFLTLIFSVTSFARKHVVSEEGPHRPNISIVATQKIFESLVLAKNPKIKFKAPMSIEAKNIECVHGSGEPGNFKCTVEFETDGKLRIRKIPNSNEFFKYLDAYNAIAIKEIAIGATHYNSKRLSCHYSLDNQPYYKCTSGIDVFF